VSWQRATPGCPLVIAHRGASALATENTVAAFRRAANDRADGVELDVLTCASGEVVVFHDDDLRRLAGRSGRVGGMTWAALRKVTLPGGTRIPTLVEAFEACGPRLLVNVELKSGGLLDASVPALVEAVARLVCDGQLQARVLVSSFDPRAVALWMDRVPSVPAALLCERAGLAAAAKVLALPLLRPRAVHPQASLCRPDLVRAFHERGYLVNTWTVDDPRALRSLADMGVDGVICNDPGAARAALGLG
jgi:glycerophosphoryl diester phosphodiesterase